MLYLIGQIIFCLLAAAILGFVVGWLLKRWRVRNSQHVGVHRSQEYDGASLRDELKASKTKISSLQLALDKCNDRNYALQQVVNGHESIALDNRIDRLGSESVTIASAKRSATVNRERGSSAAVVTGKKDDLKEILGIGPYLEQKLNQLNIFTFRQIALWKDSDIVRFSQAIGPFPDRIKRDKWVQRARELHYLKYGEQL